MHGQILYNRGVKPFSTSPQDTGEVGKKVRVFYEDNPFPGYEEVDSVSTLIQKAEASGYARILNDSIPFGRTVLEVGCGTGQLVNFLGIANRRVLGVDFSFNSLNKAFKFKTKNALSNVNFIQMDIFKMALKEETFDFIICNGVLHHTSDASSAFNILCRLLKKDGYILLGLYNRYGRLIQDIRRIIFKVFRYRCFLKLDYVLRKPMDEGKKVIWLRDQYQHPHETKHSVDEVLAWFRDNHIKYMNSIPEITITERETLPTKGLFEEHAAGNFFEHLLVQWSWIFTRGKEGGLFIIIGQKSEKIRT